MRSKVTIPLQNLFNNETMDLFGFYYKYDDEYYFVGGIGRTSKIHKRFTTIDEELRIRQKNLEMDHKWENIFFNIFNRLFQDSPMLAISVTFWA